MARIVILIIVVAAAVGWWYSDLTWSQQTPNNQRDERQLTDGPEPDPSATNQQFKNELAQQEQPATNTDETNGLADKTFGETSPPTNVGSGLAVGGNLNGDNIKAAGADGNLELDPGGSKYGESRVSVRKSRNSSRVNNRASTDPFDAKDPKDPDTGDPFASPFDDKPLAQTEPDALDAPRSNKGRSQNKTPAARPPVLGDLANLKSDDPVAPMAQMDPMEGGGSKLDGPGMGMMMGGTSPAAEYHRLEQQSMQLGQQIRRMKNARASAKNIRKVEDRLRQVVAKSFETRQQMHRAELVRLRARLQTLQKRIDAREGVSNQIIQRRIQDLTTPHVRWNSDETVPGMNSLEARTGMIDPASGMQGQGFPMPDMVVGDDLANPIIMGKDQRMMGPIGGTTSQFDRVPNGFVVRGSRGPDPVDNQKRLTTPTEDNVQSPASSLGEIVSPIPQSDATAVDRAANFIGRGVSENASVAESIKSIAAPKATSSGNPAGLNSTTSNKRSGSNNWMNLNSTDANARLPDPTSIQILFSSPLEARVNLVERQTLVIPGRCNLSAGSTIRFSLTNIADKPGLTLFGSISVEEPHEATGPYVTHNAIPVQFTVEDIEAAASAHLLTRVIYLPSRKNAELAIAGVESMVSNRLDPGVDPVAESRKRGAVLAVIRLGNRTVNLNAGAGTPLQSDREPSGTNPTSDATNDSVVANLLAQDQLIVMQDEYRSLKAALLVLDRSLSAKANQADKKNDQSLEKELADLRAKREVLVEQLHDVQKKIFDALSKQRAEQSKNQPDSAKASHLQRRKSSRTVDPSQAVVYMEVIIKQKDKSGKLTASAGYLNGTVVSDDGLIVVSVGPENDPKQLTADSISATVTFSFKRTMPARFLRYDPKSGVALFKVNHKTDQYLDIMSGPVPLGRRLTLYSLGGLNQVPEQLRTVVEDTNYKSGQTEGLVLISNRESRRYVDTEIGGVLVSQAGKLNAILSSLPVNPPKKEGSGAGGSIQYGHQVQKVVAIPASAITELLTTYQKNANENDPLGVQDPNSAPIDSSELSDHTTAGNNGSGEAAQ